MKPTEKQIEYAERLQKAGLCQNSKEWLTNNLGAYFEIADKSKLKELNVFDYDVYGPLPTFEEAIQESAKLLRNEPNISTYEYALINACMIYVQYSVFGEVWEPLCESSELSCYKAVIETLLYLKEQG